ncbi:hypothetical protein [Saccharothrix australiensis]|uniref:Subtilisin inhibitor-like n=1 Tax=Saccharothrix australiensis TaxID=2072 RepID=A0A495VXQ7_9PSEU|nr:hypothetical protein [Saccharothrix australiensis]RKT52408.1 hypothetical protein C8E97_0918 [Saccharothrix australiensis]
MSKLARVLTTTLAAAAASFAFTAGAAQATPEPDVYLYTGTLAHCTDTGEHGVDGGVFSDYTCRNGVAGYSVLVEPTYGSFTDVDLNTFDGPDGQTNCQFAGNNGRNEGVWSSYTCQLGIVGWILIVSN